MSHSRADKEKERIDDAEYNLQTAKSKFYACSLKGICERSQTSKLTLKQCQEKCQSTEYRDLISMIIAYEPSRGYELAPSDQVRVMSEIIGYRPSARVAGTYFKALHTNDFRAMRSIRSTDPYRHRFYDAIPEIGKLTKRIIGVDGRLPLDDTLIGDIVVDKAVKIINGQDLDPAEQYHPIIQLLLPDLITLFTPQSVIDSFRYGEFDVVEDYIQEEFEEQVDKYLLSDAIDRMDYEHNEPMI